MNETTKKVRVAEHIKWKINGKKFSLNVNLIVAHRKMRLYKLVQQIARYSKSGDFVKESRIITQQDLDDFSRLSGDQNPVHKSTSENLKPLVHGAFLNSIVAGIIGSKIPGIGTLVVSQNFEFPSKCYTGPVDVHIELVEVRKIIKANYEVTQNGRSVFRGTAKLVMNKLS